MDRLIQVVFGAYALIASSLRETTRVFVFVDSSNPMEPVWVDAQRELDRLCKTLGYDWSIQDGQLQLLGARDTIEPGDAIVLNPASGMIGTPEPGENGIVEVRSLLIPQLSPGRRVKLEAAAIQGNYRVEKVVYQGDTRGQDWYADLELKPV